MKTLNFANKYQVALWKNELLGQISDGMWENASPQNHWEYWHKDVTVQVDNSNLGRNFYVTKDSYMLNGKNLLEIIGERMLIMCNIIAICPLTELFISEGIGFPESVRYYDFVVKTARSGSRNEYYVKLLDMWDAFGITRDIVEHASQEMFYTMEQMNKDLFHMRKIIKMQTC